jgi:hypothetical protein
MVAASPNNTLAVTTYSTIMTYELWSVFTFRKPTIPRFFNQSSSPRSSTPFTLPFPHLHHAIVSHFIFLNLPATNLLLHLPTPLPNTTWPLW